MPVTSGANDEVQRRITPPDMQFKHDGYWKAIGPLEIGEDMNRNPTIGRTWVSRHELWSARSPQSFLLHRGKTDQNGPDPGVIYVQRSPAHEIDVYKVGLTRRSAEVRAAELSSATGVPLPFGILAKWDVGDCGQAEKEIHERLAAYRINPRREFFRVELAIICQVIGDIVEGAT
jgi:hypothetical protein